MLGMYRRFSSSAVTRCTVSSETLFVFPWITLETVAVLRPSSSAISQMRTRSCIGSPPFLPLFYPPCAEKSKAQTARTPDFGKRYLCSGAVSHMICMPPAFLICGGGKEEPVLKKLSVCVLFGGVSSEHEVSLRSAESVLNRLDKDKYHIFPVGITKDGDWILFGGKDYGMLPAGTWQNCEENRRAALSPVRGQGLLSFENDCVVRERIDVVFPVMHGENCEDGAIQGLLQIAGIPYVGPRVAASAACMDKTITKLIADAAGVRQAAWQLVTREGFARSREAALSAVEARFAYPVFVKPAGTGSSVGVAKAKDRAELETAVEAALKYDRKVLVEEFIRGQEVEVAVLGNDNPFASVCGEIDSGAEFYDYDAKYISDCAHLYIPARISEQTAEQVRELAVRVYRAMGCRGLSRVDFFVKADGEVVFNEINTIPGFTSISMYPKLFEASGIPYGELLDDLIALALEA